MPSVAAIVIGDEILSGKFADENGPFLIRRLRSLGADLRRMAVIGDTISEIAAEVSRCASTYDLVVTTGGVGPTHDDVTLEGIARAFGVGVEQNPRLVALLRDFGLDHNEAALRMATVPIGCRLIDGEGTSFPVLQMRNVFVFPGVPKLFQRKFDGIADRFAGVPVQSARLYSPSRETEIAAVLTATQAAWPEVAIGSYPRFDTGEVKVIITLEGRNPGALEEAIAALRNNLSLIEVKEG